MWFEINLIDCAVPIKEVYQSSKLPSFNAHCKEWKHNAILVKIIDHSSEYHYNSTHLKLLCETYGYFTGLIKLYIKSHQIRKAISFLTEMDDITTLFDIMKNNYNPQDWLFLLHQVEAL